MSTQPVAVIGAGWAGLAAAVTLTEAGRAVILFDSARHPGGRARTVTAFGLHLDNGQHLAIGAYSAVLGLLSTIGIDESQVFARLPLTLEQRSRDGLQLSLRAGLSAGRIGVGIAFLRAQGLSFKDKLAIVRGWSDLLRRPPDGTCAAAHLRRSGQPESAIRLLWEPLCIATLNTLPEQADAGVFVRVLQEAFDAPGSGASDLLLPACDLGAVLPQPALAWLARRGATLKLGERVTGLAIGDGVTAVSTAQSAYAVSGAIMAVPPDACARMLEPFSVHHELVNNCDAITTQPICTVYLRYPESTRIEPALLGLSGTTTQWLVDRRVARQPGVISAIISAEGPHMALDNDELVALVREEIIQCVGQMPEVLESKVIREKRATFAATPATEALRPKLVTATPGLVLAGDWTATGLPATLEGAVRSGYAAARSIIGESR